MGVLSYGRRERGLIQVNVRFSYPQRVWLSVPQACQPVAWLSLNHAEPA